MQKGKSRIRISTRSTSTGPLLIGAKGKRTSKTESGFAKNNVSLFWVEKDASEEQEDPNPAELTHIELQIDTRKEYTFHRYWVGWEL